MEILSRISIAVSEVVSFVYFGGGRGLGAPRTSATNRFLIRNGYTWQTSTKHFPLDFYPDCLRYTISVHLFDNILLYINHFIQLLRSLIDNHSGASKSSHEAPKSIRRLTRTTVAASAAAIHIVKKHSYVNM
jgi:hypothetical protein